MPNFPKALFSLALIAMSVANAAVAGEFPDDWYWERPEDYTKFEGREAPALTVGQWVGGEFKAEDMKGQIVVVDLWATWCGPCIAAMPHNTELAKKYKDNGVLVIGVCASGDATLMPKIVKDNGAEYPNAFIEGEQVTKDWPIKWYPTYAVIDRAGIVRAIGLKPDSVESVIESLLADEDPSGKVRIRPAWLEGDAEKRSRLAQLEEKSDNPPDLEVNNWINSEALALKDLKGKVVVLDFWATWCGPCIRAIPEHNAMMEKYGEKGLVIIGVTATHGGDKVEEIVKAHGIKYPICVDDEDKTNTTYAPNGFPDYYIIDRNGKLRIADCANDKLEEAVKALLEEKQEETPTAQASAELVTE